MIEMLLSTYLYGEFDCMLSCHVQDSEWILTIVCLNGKDLPTQRRFHIWSLSGSKVIWIQNHLNQKTDT